MKSITWIIDGSLKKQLHQNARISPAVELIKQGWHVTMITSEAPEGAKDCPINFIEIDTSKIYFFGMFIYYAKILRLFFANKLPGKILMFQLDSMSPILLTIPVWQMLFHRKPKIHVVLDYRSMPMDTISYRGKLRSLVFFIGHIISLKLDIHVTAITNRLANTLQLSGEKLLGIWPSGANINDFTNAFETRIWPDAHKPIRLLYMGAIHAERNLIAVIEAAQMAKEKGVNLSLDIVGSGHQKEILKRQVKKSASSFIKVWGPVPQNHIPELLGNYDIGILPFPDVPKMNVSSAIKMFEYMAAGMPVLATKIEAHLRVLNDRNFIFWSGEKAENMAEAMAAVSASKLKLPMLGKNAREYAQYWSWEESAKKLSAALEKVMSEKTS